MTSVVRKERVRLRSNTGSSIGRGRERFATWPTQCCRIKLCGDQGFGGNTGTLKIEENIDAADHKGMERALKATMHGYCAQV